MLEIVDIYCLCLFQIIVTVWKQEEEKAEIQEHGYLSILQQKSPCQTFRQDLNTFKAQGKFLHLAESGNDHNAQGMTLFRFLVH